MYFRIEDDDYERLRRIADRERRTVSALVRLVLEDYIAEQEDE